MDSPNAGTAKQASHEEQLIGGAWGRTLLSDVLLYTTVASTKDLDMQHMRCRTYQLCAIFDVYISTLRPVSNGLSVIVVSVEALRLP